LITREGSLMAKKDHPVERRRALGISQEKLARVADCSLNTVRVLEHRLRPLSAAEKRVIAAIEQLEARA